MFLSESARQIFSRCIFSDNYESLILILPEVIHIFLNVETPLLKLVRWMFKRSPHISQLVECYLLGNIPAFIL